MESEQPAAPPPPAVMAEGDTVVFDINGDKHIFIALDGNRCGAAHASGGRLQRLALAGQLLHISSKAGQCIRAPMARPRLRARSKVKLCGVQCSAAPLIGAPWGSMWTLDPDGKSLQRTS